jgi:hypothetical protein
MGVVIPFPSREALAMSAMPWFRMYAEFATDPTVQALSFDDQRHFVMILCLKCAGILDKRYPDPQARLAVLRKAMGLDSMAFDEMKRRLTVSCNVDDDLQPINWNKRQYVSDSSTRRVRAFRKRLGNVSVTPSDTDTDKRKNKIPEAGISTLSESDPDPDDFLIWTAGIELLGESKRGLMGKLIKTHGRELVARKLADLMAMTEKPRDPAAYFVGVMRKLERRFQA